MPERPVETGSPVALVRVAADGVPRLGVVKTGEVVRAIPPDPDTAKPRAVITPVPVVVVAGATPAPPPIISAFAANTAEDAQPDAELKYGMPPLVPATVRASVPDAVTGDPLTEISPPVNDAPTEVTVPAFPAAQVPSPRQNVEAEAPVPELRFVTGRLPVTPVDNGRPVALVRMPDDGVPRAGVTKVGEVARAIPPVPVTAAASAVPTPVPRPVNPPIGKPVALVKTAADGVPNAGVVNVGDVVSAIEPDPETARPSAVRTPVPVVIVEGAVPAPPPIIKELAASAADVAHVDALEK